MELTGKEIRRIAEQSAEKAVLAERQRIRAIVVKALEEIDKEATMFQPGSHGLGVRQGRNNACNWFLSLLSAPPTPVDDKQEKV